MDLRFQCCSWGYTGGFPGTACDARGCSGAGFDVNGCTGTGFDIGSCTSTGCDVGGRSGAGCNAGGLAGSFDGSRLLRPGSSFMTWLFTGPAKRPPALDDYHHVLLLIVNDVENGLDALSIKRDGKDIVNVSRPISWFQ